MRYIVCYDIVEDRRRNRIAKVMEDYGRRVQKSVFECLLEDETLTKMLLRLEHEMDPDEDSIRVYLLCARCSEAIRIFGMGDPVEEVEVYIV